MSELVEESLEFIREESLPLHRAYDPVKEVIWLFFPSFFSCSIFRLLFNADPGSYRPGIIQQLDTLFMTQQK